MYSLKSRTPVRKPTSELSVYLLATQEYTICLWKALKSVQQKTLPVLDARMLEGISTRALGEGSKI